MSCATIFGFDGGFKRSDNVAILEGQGDSDMSGAQD